MNISYSQLIQMEQYRIVIYKVYAFVTRIEWHLWILFCSIDFLCKHILAEFQWQTF